MAHGKPDQFPRKWSAEITYVDNALSLSLVGSDDCPGQTFTAADPDEDLKRSMARSAYAEACQRLLKMPNQEACAFIQLFKTTRKHGRRRDWTFYTIDKHDAANWALKKIVDIR